MTNTLAIAVGKLVDQACVDLELSNAYENNNKDSPPEPLPRSVLKQDQPNLSPERFASNLDRESDDSRSFSSPVQEYPCSPKTLKRYVEQVAQLLKAARSPAKIAIFIESLAHMTTLLVLPHLVPYITGEAPNMQNLSDDDTSFVSVAAIYSLHHIAANNPAAVSLNLMPFDY